MPNQVLITLELGTIHLISAAFYPRIRIMPVGLNTRTIHKVGMVIHMLGTTRLYTAIQMAKVIRFAILRTTARASPMWGLGIISKGTQM